MGARDLLAHGQPEAGSVLLGGEERAQAVGRAGGQTRPAVFHGDGQLEAILCGGTADLTPGRGGLECVEQEVEHDLLHGFVVSLDSQLRIHLTANGLACQAMGAFEQAARVVHQFPRRTWVTAISRRAAR